MSWQSPPTQQASQYAATPQYPPPQSPGLAPTLPAVARWAGAAVAVCLLITAAVVLHRTVLSQYFGGAASPEEAVTQVISAIEGGDLTQLGLMLPPDEVAGIGDIVKQAQRIASDIGEGGSGGFSGHTTDNGVQVSVKNLQLKTQSVQDGLTKVSIENADITASFDPAKVSGPLKTVLDKKGASAKSYTVTVRGSDVTTDGNTHTLRLDGREQSAFAMTVQRDGSWYVSPFFTYLQYATEAEGQTTSRVVTTPGFDSPDKAAEGYISALAKSINAHDVTPFARATGGFEGRLMQTYSNLINSQLGRGRLSVDVDSSQFRVLSVDGNTARVRPESLRLTATASSDSYAVEWDGHCLKIDSGSHKRVCLGDKENLGPLSPLIERLEYLVAVRSDGGWKISATRTVLSWLSDALGWIGDAEIPIIKALTKRDPTEVTKVAKVAGTVGIGNTTTIQVDQIGPFVDGGYAVVAIPDPSGARFSVSCYGKSTMCKVVSLVSPSGKSQGRYSGGGESGDYKAIVAAETGNVQISVRSSYY